MEKIICGQARKFIIDKHTSMCAGKDKKISNNLISIFAATHSISTDTGVHAKLTGDSGIGKSYSTKKFTDLVPSTEYIWTLPSGKNLFYNSNLHAGMVVVIDEWENADVDLVRVLKLATSDFQEATILGTVINFEGIDKPIPPRIAFIIISVSALESAELRQRFTSLDIPKDEQYLKDINKKQRNKANKPARKKDKPDFDTQVCRCIYSILYINTYDILVPFSNVIEWNDINQTRNWESFVDSIRCSAFYNIPNRERLINKYDKNEIIYLATYEDYLTALEIYSETSDTNSTKLTKNELKTINILMDARKKDIEGKRTSETTVEDLHIGLVGTDEISTFGDMYIPSGMYIKDLANEVGVSDVTIRNIIRGVKNNGGLLEKVVGIHSMLIGDKVGTQTHHKEMIWYDGPDHIVSKIAKASREECVKETQSI
jgi:hypothetical protein